MSIIRVFPGRIDEPKRLEALMRYVVRDKKALLYEDYSEAYWSVVSSGLPLGRDVRLLTTAMLRQHGQYLWPGKRLAYHFLLDFNNEMEPFRACITAKAINAVWPRLGIAYIQGLHLFKGPERQRWPHVHVVLNAITSGGNKFHLGKQELRSLKLHANTVLKDAGTSIIKVYEEDDYYESYL